MQTTVAKLRLLLAQYFDPPRVDTVVKRMAQAGLIPAGKPGHNGVGSARITPQDAALLLIALAVTVEPIEAPAEAQRIAAFKLRYVERSGGAERGRRAIDGPPVTFIQCVVAQIARADPDTALVGWRIGQHRAAQRSPEQLVFTGPIDPDPDAVERSTVVPAMLIRQIAALLSGAEAI